MGNPVVDRWLIVIVVAVFLLAARHIHERAPSPVSRLLVVGLPAVLAMAVLLAIFQHLNWLG